MNSKPSGKLDRAKRRTRQVTRTGCVYKILDLFVWPAITKYIFQFDIFIMTFSKKIILLIIINIFLIGFVNYYFWLVKGDYYFPDRYEMAVAWIAYTIIFCLIMTFMFIVYHVIKAKSGNK